MRHCIAATETALGAHQAIAQKARADRRRASLLRGVSALALACVLTPAAAWAQCLPATQTISTPVGATILSNGGAIEITGAGNVTVLGGWGIQVFPCDATSVIVDTGGNVSGLTAGVLVGFGNTVTTLANSGMIAGNTGVNNFGTIATLTNSGLVMGNTAGIANNNAIGTLSNSGTIGGGIFPGIGNGGSIGLLTNSNLISSASQAGVYNGGTIATLSNTGTILGAGASSGGLSNKGGTIGALSNSGTISGDLAGVLNSGSIGALSNTGTGAILGVTTGLSNNGGAISSLTNAASIAGGHSGMTNSGGSIGALSNSGQIAGAMIGINNGTASGIAGQIGTLGNTGSIGGGNVGIVNAGSISTLSNGAGGVINGGKTGLNNTGSIGGMSNAGTISGKTNAIVSSGGKLGTVANSGLISGNITVGGQNLTISGGTGASFGTLTNGALTVSTGNLLFAGGNTHLDQDISVNGGAGTVTNDGVLQLSNSHAITGNFLEGADAELDIQASGDTSGTYGSLNITGTADLAGVLELDLMSGFTLTAGDVFDILSFANDPGDFSLFSLNGIGCTPGSTDVWSCGGWIFTENLGASGLALDVSSSALLAPEPASLTLFGSALAGLGWLRRRRNPSGRATRPPPGQTSGI